MTDNIATRQVSISGEDVRELRHQLEAKSAELKDDQKQMIGYLVRRAEAETKADTMTDALWTWTYRF